MIFLKLHYKNQVFPVRQIVLGGKPVLIGTIELLLLLDQNGKSDVTAKIILDNILYFVNFFEFHLPEKSIIQKL